MPSARGCHATIRHLGSICLRVDNWVRISDHEIMCDALEGCTNPNYQPCWLGCVRFRRQTLAQLQPFPIAQKTAQSSHGDPQGRHWRCHCPEPTANESISTHIPTHRATRYWENSSGWSGAATRHNTSVGGRLHGAMGLS